MSDFVSEVDFHDWALILYFTAFFGFIVLFLYAFGLNG